MSIELVGIIVLSVILGGVFAAYTRVAIQLAKYKKEQAILDAQTRQKAAKIVEEAKDKALEILENTKIDAKESQEEIDKQLEDITKKQVDYYKELMLNITNNIKDDTKKALEQQVNGAQNTVVQKIEDDYTLAKQQVELYKQARMKQIDTNAVEIIREFTKIALGKVWSNQEQEELIKTALEEAKKQYVV